MYNENISAVIRQGSELPLAPAQELHTIIGKIESLLDEGRVNAQSVHIIQKQKLVLKEENKRLLRRLDEAQARIDAQDMAIVQAGKAIARLMNETLLLKEAAKRGQAIWTNDGEL